MNKLSTKGLTISILVAILILSPSITAFTEAAGPIRKGSDIIPPPSLMDTGEPEGPHTFSERLEVEWTLDLDGGVGSVRIADAANVAGEQGTSEQYLVREIGFQGSISDLDVRFTDPVNMEASPLPFMVPGIVGLDEGEEHPLWKGHIEKDIFHRYEIANLGSQNSDGTFEELLSLRLFPVDYTINGKCTVYNTIEIEYTITGSPGPSLSSRSVPNGKTLGDPSYLIITHRDLASSLLELVKWKSQKGVFTRLATVQDIAANYSKKDIQEEIRAYVMDMEAAYDIDYLLLVGDVNLVKTRNTVNLYPYTPYGEPSTFASDSYFACVDQGSSWNGDNDKYYAESGELDDALPNLAVGRIASNDKSVISDLVDHLIQRERGFTWDPEMEKAVFIAGDPDTVPGYPPDTLDHFWDTYAKDVFDDRETIYYDGSGTLSFSSTSFRDTIGNKIQAACYFSHGTQTGLPGLFSNTQVPTLSNSGPEGSLFTMACLTGYFDSTSTESFAEVMTETKDRGVLGYIGSSRLAVGEIDTTYSGDAPGLEEDYWRSVRKAAEGNLTPTIGDIYRDAVTHFSTSFYPFPTDYYGYSAQRTFLEYNLFGEPEAPLFFRPPENLSLEFDIAEDNDTIWARVTNSTGAPIEGAAVTLFRFQELGISALTNETGEVNITIPDSNGGLVNITAHRTGDLPVNHTIELPDELAPTPLYTIDPPEPDGFSDIYITEPVIRLFSDEEGEIEFRMDGGPSSLHSEDVVVVGENGHHVVEFRAIDKVGHYSEWMTFNFSVDNVLPELYVTTDPEVPDGENGWFNSPVTVGLGSPEELAMSYYRIDDSIETALDDNFTLYNGVHDVRFRAFDSAGNVNFTSARISIDTTLPYSTIEVSREPDGDNGYYVTPPTIILNAVDHNGAFPQYRWDNGTWEDYDVPIYPPKGVHRLEYRAVDRTGNIEQIANFLLFSYDPDPPALSHNITPDRPDGDNDIYVTKPIVELFVEPGEMSDFGIRYFLAEMDQGFDWTSDGMRYIGPLLIPQGKWRLHTMAIDAAGNKHFPAPIDIHVDTTPPDMVWNITPVQPDGENMWYVEAPVLSVSEVSEEAYVLFSLDDNESWMEFRNNVSLPPGEHTLRIMAVDRAGNTAVGLPFSYRYDDKDPIASMSTERSTFFIDEVINLSANTSTDENGPLIYLFNSSLGTSSLWVNEPAYSLRFNETGNYTVHVVVRDRSGRTNRSRDVQISIIERPPPPEDDDDDDLVIEPFDPEPVDEKSWTETGLEERLFVRGGIILILLLIIAILVLLVIRKVQVKEVQWEGEDDWLNEDWVDVDIDDEPVLETDVLIFE
ncbi:MAG: C25 family cysteine peptidase [Thermoplasmatota archaeon]